MKSDETCTLTCVCGCRSIRFDLFEFKDEPLEVTVTPYAIADHPFYVPNGFWGRIKTAWHVLFGGHPEPVLIMEPEERKQLLDFLQRVEEKESL